MNFLDLRKSIPSKPLKKKQFLDLRSAASAESEASIDLEEFSDALTSLFGKDFQMPQVQEPDDLTKVLALMIAGNGRRAVAQTPEELAKAAKNPTRAQRMAMMAAHMKKARRSRKAAASAVEDCHKMLKAAFMAKAAKKDKGDDEDDFDKAEAMSKLQKAFGEMEKMKTFMKAAEGQLEKLARSGERGQETADGSAHYRVPQGVTDLNPDEMARMGPGDGSGGMPPVNLSTSEFPGKAAGSYISKEHADLLVKNAKLEGENENAETPPRHRRRCPPPRSLRRLTHGRRWNGRCRVSREA